MSLSTRALSFIIVSVFLLGGCGVQSGSSGGPTSYKPVFEATSCPFTVGSGVFIRSQVRCGYLVVPENRQSDTGRTAKVAVAVFKAPFANPVRDPLVYLVGGPGTPIVAKMGASLAASAMPAFVGNRDLILVDQRGSGLSKPSLACRPQDTLRSCHDWLVKKGIHLAAYNTIENAADIADLRIALGYRQMNILGESYGSTLALQLMRDHPQGIRSVMMNGVTGPTFNMFNDFIPNTWHGIQQVFKSCAASSTCNAQYPHLSRSFIHLLAHLQAHPAKLRMYDYARNRSVTGSLNAVTLWWATNEYLADPSNLGSIPRLISQMARGDFSGAIQIAESQQVTGQSPVTVGMNESMECSGEQATSSPAAIAARAQAVPIPSSVRRALIASETSGLQACATWNVPSIPSVNRTYFHSVIPMLLMPGSFDTKTSPAQAYALAKHLGHSSVVLFPSLSHEIVWSGCPASVMGDFLEHPNRTPDTSCAAQMPTFWE